MYHFLHLHEMNTSSLQSKRQNQGEEAESCPYLKHLVGGDLLTEIDV